jgi:hypothetical protein
MECRLLEVEQTYPGFRLKSQSDPIAELTSGLPVLRKQTQPHDAVSAFTGRVN